MNDDKVKLHSMGYYKPLMRDNKFSLNFNLSLIRNALSINSLKKAHYPFNNELFANVTSNLTLVADPPLNPLHLLNQLKDESNHLLSLIQFFALSG